MSASNAKNEAEIRQFPAPAPASKAEAPAKPDAPVTEAPQPEVAAQGPVKPKRSAKRFILPILIVAAIGAGGWYGYEYWTTGRFMVSTDDAYIQGDITAIAPKVTGYIDRIDVVANQRVKAGDPLVTLDNGDYRSPKSRLRPKSRRKSSHSIASMRRSLPPKLRCSRRRPGSSTRKPS